MARNAGNRFWEQKLHALTTNSSASGSERNPRLIACYIRGWRKRDWIWKEEICSAGYTPLHMAVGYSHVSVVKQLLDAGASPDIPDNQGRNVVQLVDSIRSSMPFNPQLAGKRLALEEVAALLAGLSNPPSYARWHISSNYIEQTAENLYWPPTVTIVHCWKTAE